MSKESVFSFAKSHPVITIFLTFMLTACGGGGGGESSPGDDPVANSLTSLGVDISTTPRKADNSTPLPEDYSPFGSSSSFEQFDELLLLGFPLAAASGFSSELTLLELDRIGSGASYDTDVLFAPDTALTPWALSVGESPAALRVAARGDIDGDGLEELAVVYRKPGQSTIELQIYEDQTGSFAEGQTLVLSSDPVTSLAMASGDFNGDGYADLVVGLVSDSGATLLFLNNDNGAFSLSTVSKNLPQAFAGSEIALVIKSGNLDYDPSHELVVLVNELFQQAGAGNPESGTTRYFLFDDGKNDHTEIDNALVQADLSAVNRTAIVADVSLGDVDGDNIDEIVFAGLTHFDPNGLCDYNYLLVVLDDLVRERTPLGAMEHQPDIHGGCASAKGALRFVHVNTPDLDGDGVAEIQANELLFEDFLQFPPWTSLVDSTDTVAVISDGSLFAENGGFTGRFNQRNSAMVVADLTSDKRQDIILYSQSTNRLEVWGLSEADPNIGGGVLRMQWRMLKSIPVAPPASGDDLRPLLLPINVNHDSLAISFDEGEYQLVYTEPVLIAALAAAPCYENLGQNADACRTSFGTAKSTSVQTEETFTVTAGVTVGFESEFSALGVKTASVEALGTLKAFASRIRSSAYTLTRRIVYTTGPLEDTVIFTTIPLDQYTYTIVSHSDPELIGSKVVVSMPRSPVELQVERSYYNANVVSGGPLIDDSVFSHVVGDPSSYPGESTKDSLLSQFSGYDNGTAAVSRTSGDTTLEINIATESGVGAAYGVDFEMEVKGTVGVVVAGFSVGVGRENSLQIVHGTESTYTGSVPGLPANNIAGNRYEWGLFTYVKDNHRSGQQFEVLNYWVE